MFGLLRNLIEPSSRALLIREVVAADKWLVHCAIDARQTHSYSAWWAISQSNWMHDILKAFESRGGELPLDNDEVKAALDYVSGLKSNVIADQRAANAGNTLTEFEPKPKT